MTDVKPKTVEAFSLFLYFGKLYEAKDPSLWTIDPKGSRNDRTNVNLSESRLVDIWIFGDRIGAPDLQNAAIDSLHQRDM